MKNIIKYRYVFHALGGQINHEWLIEAEYSREEYPAFDLEGDQASTPDVFESIEIISIEDYTLNGGESSGRIDKRDIPAELLRKITVAGIKIGWQNAVGIISNYEDYYYVEIHSDLKRELTYLLSDKEVKTLQEAHRLIRPPAGCDYLKMSVWRVVSDTVLFCKNTDLAKRLSDFLFRRRMIAEQKMQQYPPVKLFTERAMLPAPNSLKHER